jgi:hypothetical protein
MEQVSTSGDRGCGLATATDTSIEVTGGWGRSELDTLGAANGRSAVIALRMTTSVPDDSRECGWSGVQSHRKAGQ